MNHTKQFRIVQIGCGVVGRAYVSAYEKVGCQVIGIEASEKLIEMYKKNMNIYHINDDLSNIKDIDFIMISICTPLKDDKLDLSYLFNSIPNVATLVTNSPNVLVIIRSTVPPTTTREYKTRLEMIVKHSVNVLFQPEFLRAMSALDDAMNPWHIVFGVDDGVDVSNLLELYSRFVPKENITIMTIEESELLKVFHNSYNATKISFTNQSSLLCNAISEKHKVPINCEKIMATMVKTCEGIRNPKYGTKPGHAYYGTCLPKDSAELASLEKTYGLSARLFENVVKVNDEIKKTDKEEIINGDHHITFDKLKSE